MWRSLLLAILFSWLGAGCDGANAGNGAATTPSLPVAPSPTPTLPSPPTISPNISPASKQIDSLPFASPEYGIQAFWWWHPERIPGDIELIKEMGFGWVKHSFPWREIEGIEKGAYDEYRPDLIVNSVTEAGLQLLVRIDRQPFWSQSGVLKQNRPPDNYQDFFDFCGWVAERYQGRISAYQIWNEPNLTREWGDEPPDPAAYAELLKGCYLAIKAADPEAIVISAGLATTETYDDSAMPDTIFLQQMYDAGAAPYFDVAGINAPGYKAEPELSPEEAADIYGSRFFTFRRVEDMREVMETNGDADKQIAVLEMGWTLDTIHPDRSWYAVDEATQAEYLGRAYQFAKANWSPWIGLMSAIYIADPDWTEENEEYWWSIVLPDGALRQSFYTLKELEK